MSSPELEEPRRKRVRFAESPQVHLYQDCTSDKAPTQHDADQHLGGDMSQPEDATRSSTDRQQTSQFECHNSHVSCDDIAAAEAAKRRRHMRWMTDAEDLSVLDELEEAEELYDEPEELFTTDGIPIEPFHLRRERAEGFFDGEGNYVEYKLDPVSDAWLDSLEDGPVDAALIARLAAARAAKSDPAADEALVLDEDDAAIYKKRIVDLLQPRESVLSALRRLGHNSSCRSIGSGSLSAAVAASKSRRRQRRTAGQQEPQQQQQQLQEESCGFITKQQNAGQQQAQLCGDGSHQQQQQQTSGQQQHPGVHGPAAAELGQPPPSPVTQLQHRTSHPGGGISSNTGGQVNSSPASLSPTGSSPPKIQRSGTVKAAAAAAAAAAAGIPPENRAAFDRLTEYADILLTNGDVNIYTSTREILQQQLDVPGLAVMLGESTSDLVSLDVRSTPQRGRTAWKGAAAAAAAAGAAREPLASGLQLTTTAAATQQKPSDGPGLAAGTLLAAADAADVDMFADDGVNTPAPLVESTNAAATTSAAHAAGLVEAADVPQQQVPPHDQQERKQHSADVASGAAAAAVDADGDEAMEDATAAGSTVAAAAASAGTGGGSGSSTGSGYSSGTTSAPGSAMDGFQLDESSGCYYSSTLGYYFDPRSQLFGDASSGLWYRYVEETGSYQLVDSC